MPSADRKSTRSSRVISLSESKVQLSLFYSSVNIWHVPSSTIDISTLQQLTKNYTQTYHGHFSIFSLQIFRIIVEVHCTRDNQWRFWRWARKKTDQQISPTKLLQFLANIFLKIKIDNSNTELYVKYTCGFTLKIRTKTIENVWDNSVYNFAWSIVEELTCKLLAHLWVWHI